MNIKNKNLKKYKINLIINKYLNIEMIQLIMVCIKKLFPNTNKSKNILLSRLL